MGRGAAGGSEDEWRERGKVVQYRVAGSDDGDGGRWGCWPVRWERGVGRGRR